MDKAHGGSKPRDIPTIKMKQKRKTKRKRGEPHSDAESERMAETKTDRQPISFTVKAEREQKESVCQRRW